MAESVPCPNHDSVYAAGDPGSTGAVALLLGRRVRVFDVPLMAKPEGGQIIDDAAMIALARMIASISPAAYVHELTWGLKGQGGGGQYKFGDTSAAMRVAMRSAGLRVLTVSSQRWTAGLRVGSDKMKHVEEAKRLFPADAHLFTPVRGCVTLEQCKGRADATLIAHFAQIRGL